MKNGRLFVPLQILNLSRLIGIFFLHSKRESLFTMLSLPFKIYILHHISVHILLHFYIVHLHSSYKPKSAKRKIASLKAFFHYCKFKEIINQNPFDKVEIRFREPITLPKTVPLETLEIFLATIYNQYTSATTSYKRKKALRDIAVTELLFSTGMRISELCNLTPSDVNFNDTIVLIYGKGAKERKMQIGNANVKKIYYPQNILEINSIFNFCP